MMTNAETAPTNRRMEAKMRWRLGSIFPMVGSRYFYCSMCLSSMLGTVFAYGL